MTELESCVLAVIWRRSPCSAYAVRKEFASSISPEWSASAGSIYPVIARLERLGLVSADAAKWGRGAKRSYRVTSEGYAALLDWIGGLPGKLAAAPPDPIRTRMFFVDALTGAQAQAIFLQHAEETTRAQLTVADAAAKTAESRVDRVASLGAVYALKARLAWLRQAKRLLSGEEVQADDPD